MRIPKAWVSIIAKKTAGNLLSKKLVDSKVPEDKLISQIEEIVMEELMVEDRLHEEIREILKKHGPDIERGRMDYRKLFELTKQKLVRERNLVL